MGVIYCSQVIFIGFYQVPVLIKVSEKSFTNVTTRSDRHRVGTFFYAQKAPKNVVSRKTSVPKYGTIEVIEVVIEHAMENVTFNDTNQCENRSAKSDRKGVFIYESHRSFEPQIPANTGILHGRVQQQILIYT